MNVKLILCAVQRQNIHNDSVTLQPCRRPNYSIQVQHWYTAAGGNLKSPFFTLHWAGRTLCSDNYHASMVAHVHAHTPTHYDLSSVSVTCKAANERPGLWWCHKVCCWQNMLPGDIRLLSSVRGVRDVFLAVTHFHRDLITLSLAVAE